MYGVDGSVTSPPVFRGAHRGGYGSSRFGSTKPRQMLKGI